MLLLLRLTAAAVILIVHRHRPVGRHAEPIPPPSTLPRRREDNVVTRAKAERKGTSPCLQRDRSTAATGRVLSPPSMELRLAPLSSHTRGEGSSCVKSSAAVPPSRLHHHRTALLLLAS
ncbi:hypothetical protein S245_020438 [Arachis hypogaea]